MTGGTVLQPQEAVESAVEEFKLKNADMTDVIMTAQGGDIAECVFFNACTHLTASSLGTSPR